MKDITPKTFAARRAPDKQALITAQEKDAE
jgi:hypothetical protein